MISTTRQNSPRVRTKTKARKEKSEASSTGNSNSEGLPKGNNKGRSKQQVAIPSNLIDINDLAKAIKKLGYENDNDGETRRVDTPFTTKILKVRLPKRMKGNFTLRYDGTTNPRAHIHDFVSFMALNQVSSRTTCKYFAITLTDNTKVWFTNLAPRSIFS